MQSNRTMNKVKHGKRIIQVDIVPLYYGSLDIVHAGWDKYYFQDFMVDFLTGNLYNGIERMFGKRKGQCIMLSVIKSAKYIYARGKLLESGVDFKTVPKSEFIMTCKKYNGIISEQNYSTIIIAIDKIYEEQNCV